MCKEDIRGNWLVRGVHEKAGAEPGECEKMTLGFMESGKEYPSVPEWVDALVNFGFDWAGKVGQGRRRIAIISMPSESAAAGLAALGALSHRLTMEGANELEDHRRRVRELKDESVHGLYYRSNGSETGPFYSCSDGTEMRLVYEGGKNRYSGLKQLVMDGMEGKIRFSGEPPVFQENAVEGESVYQEIPGCGNEILMENLKSTDKWLCFAGRKKGRVDAERILKSVSFKAGGREFDLKQLLLLSNGHRSIYRTCYYNTRGNANVNELPLNRIGLVVADGLGSLVKVLDQKEFAEKNVIGVFHRVRKRDDLEALDERMSELDRFYDRQAMDSGTALPTGVGATVFERRGGN
jgi:hypothetical protein